MLEEEALAGEVVLGESSASGWWGSWVAIAAVGFPGTTRRTLCESETDCLVSTDCDTV